MLSFIFAFLSTYCKEPTFGSFLVFSFIIFLFFRKNKKISVFCLALVLNAIVFLLLYYVFAIRNMVGFYRGGAADLSRIAVIKEIIKGQPAIVLFFLLAFAIFINSVRKIRNKTFVPCIEDALLFSSVAYAFGIFLLRFYAPYYFLPCFVLAFPAIIHYGIKIFSIRIKPFTYFVFVCTFCIFSFTGKDFIKHSIRARFFHGHKEMDELRLIASHVNSDNHFFWYDTENLSDVIQGYKYTILPYFVNYINENKEFTLTCIERLPENLDSNTYIISIDEISDYENDGYEKLPIDLLNVYSVGVRYEN